MPGSNATEHHPPSAINQLHADTGAHTGDNIADTPGGKI